MKERNIVNLLQLAEGEKVTNMLCYPKDEDNKGGFVTMVTKQGLIKRTPLEQYANIRKTGLIGIALNEGDALAWTRLTTGNDMLIVATRNGIPASTWNITAASTWGSSSRPPAIISGEPWKISSAGWNSSLTVPSSSSS